MTTTEQTSIEITDHDTAVREITLCRPELLNRFDPLLHRELVEVLQRTRLDAQIRAVVLRSTGKAFSAGGDFDLMREAQASASVRRDIVDDARRLLSAVLDLPQPIVAAVQGAAIGLGATIPLLCDALVASRNAILADTHVNVGLVAGDGGCLVWPSSAGSMRARRHLLTGDPIDAETAFSLGMVTDLVDEPDDAGPAALAIATKIAAHAPMAVQGTKRALNNVTRQRAGETFELSLALEEQTLASEDLLEGIAAFQERRNPQFSGR